MRRGSLKDCQMTQPPSATRRSKPTITMRFTAPTREMRNVNCALSLSMDVRSRSDRAGDLPQRPQALRMSGVRSRTRRGPRSRGAAAASSPQGMSSCSFQSSPRLSPSFRCRGLRAVLDIPLFARSRDPPRRAASAVPDHHQRRPRVRLGAQPLSLRRRGLLACPLAAAPPPPSAVVIGARDRKSRRTTP